MLTLYHGNTSVCSAKVRIGLAEKRLEWDGVLLNLAKNEQNDPAYLKLNPNGVVPTLVDDDLIVVESSVILEYVDELSAENPLMPADRKARARTRVWLTRCIDIHAAINTMTFSTVMRQQILASKSAEEIEASIAKMANPATAAKRRNLLENGLRSAEVMAAFFTLRRMFDDMQQALETQPWLFGAQYSLADTALLAYVDRLERLGMQQLWVDRTPRVGDWLAASRSRPSFAAAYDPYIDPQADAKMRAGGDALWPDVKRQWDRFIAAR